MHPNFFNQLLLICKFEFNRTFATRKGLLNLLTFALVWCFILVYPLRIGADLLSQGKSFMQTTGFFEFIGLDSLQHWAIPEFGVFWHFALLLFPMLSVSIAADQTCSDRERGTLRFILLRCSRDSLFFGRFVGVMMIQTALISATALSVFGLVLYRDSTLFSPGLSELLVIITNVVLAVLPFTALMAVLSAWVKTARSATLRAILIWTFASWVIGILAYYFPPLSMIQLLVPGYQLAELAQLSAWQTLQLAYIPLLQSAVLLGFGRWITLRQSL